MLEVQEVAMVTEVAWRKKVENDLTVRQDRQKTRLLQTRWLPGPFAFFHTRSLVTMRSTPARNVATLRTWPLLLDSESLVGGMYTLV